MTKKEVEQSGPDHASMVRMVDLLADFAENKTVKKPPTISPSDDCFMDEHPAINIFTAYAYEDGWMIPGFDWPNWDEGREIAGNPAEIGKVDLLTIRKLITALVRNERFCESALQSAYKEGVIEAILRRIEQLSSEETEG